MNDANVSWSERGNVAPLAVVSSLLLFVVLAFAIDQSIAYAAKVRQENALDAARSACMNASFALVAKNAENPGLEVARRIAQTVRAEGCLGRIGVWFYEVAREELPASRRVWGIAVQIEELSPTVFARGYGMASIPVASKRLIMAEPYSDSVTWRPDGNQNGLYVLEEGNLPDAITYTALLSPDDYPDELMRETNAMVADDVADMA